jgi:hypothetical protein
MKKEEEAIARQAAEDAAKLTEEERREQEEIEQKVGMNRERKRIRVYLFSAMRGRWMIVR